jgi:hypothetical protein
LHPAEFRSFVVIENRPETAGRWHLAPAGYGQHDKGSGVTGALTAAFSPQECAPVGQGFAERPALFLCVARQQWVAAKF